MAHLKQHLGRRDQMSLSLAQHPLFSSQALEGHQLHVVGEPALDELPLRTGQHPSHFEDVAGTMPLHICTVEAAESEPYHPALFIERELPPLDDDGVAGALTGILAHLLRLSSQVMVKY
jgi:hypothetical protein